MTRKQANGWRFLGLGALTAASAAATIANLKVLAKAGVVPTMDAMHQRAPGRKEWPSVSIIVPARNEERNLPRLLPSLLRQRYPNYEIVVVDDQSEDDTPRILARFASEDKRLKVVRGAKLPKGWLGKPHAMMQGAQKARGEWLLFTDADTVHSPLSLSSSVAYALSHDVDLLSILPDYELLTPSERLLMPLAFLGIMSLYPAYKVNDPASKIAIANGQYMLVRRDVYDEVGGAARVKDKIAEDLEFGKAVKADGYKLRLADGRHLMSVRMYTNFAEVWQGWSKNAVLSFRENPLSGVFSVIGLFSLAVMPLVLWNWAARIWRSAQWSGKRADQIAADWVAALAAWNTGVPLIYRRRVDKMLGLPPGWTFTQPLGAAIFAAMMLYSFVRLAMGRGVTWKGRTYARRD
jgi:chlorobactene glucosyltransferase